MRGLWIANGQSARSRCARVLLQGLDEIVHFNKKFVAFEDAPDGQVTARFDDGTTATCDLLIGADGANSRVRTQLLPHAQRAETGIMAVSGKLGLNQQVRKLTPPAIFLGPTLMLGPKGCFLFANAVEYGGTNVSVPHAGVLSNDDPLLATDREEYVMWGFSARREKFGSYADRDAGEAEALKAAVLALMKDWHPALRWIVQNTTDINPFRVKSSVPIPPWRTRNVTLLGDALHNMTPFRGIGANVALRDAAALRRTLVRIVADESLLLESLAAYERQMIEYGFQAVRMSLNNMRQVHSEGLARELTKLSFRFMNLIPQLRETVSRNR
jgi:2-polyprenyl-6-methoxyphenol hydroxylase-like FAD-dependent oxidoreductase